MHCQLSRGCDKHKTQRHSHDWQPFSHFQPSPCIQSHSHLSLSNKTGHFDREPYLACQAQEVYSAVRMRNSNGFFAQSNASWDESTETIRWFSKACGLHLWTWTSCNSSKTCFVKECSCWQKSFAPVFPSPVAATLYLLVLITVDYHEPHKYRVRIDCQSTVLWDRGFAIWQSANSGSTRMDTLGETGHWGQIYRNCRHVPGGSWVECYQQLDGLPQISILCAVAVGTNQSSLAITDHHSSFRATIDHCLAKFICISVSLNHHSNGLSILNHHSSVAFIDRHDIISHCWALFTIVNHQQPSWTLTMNHQTWPSLT